MGQLATIKVVNAAMAIKSEAAVPNAWIYVDVKGIDIGTYVQAAMRTVNQAIADGTITLPEGYSIFWSGQYEYMLRATERLLRNDVRVRNDLVEFNGPTATSPVCPA